ncbi:MAG: hypothetical protein AB7E55_01235 [Pigmentiphaga sp.]
MAVTVELSNKALVTASQAENYIHGDEATSLSDLQKDNIRLLINGVSAFFEDFTGLPLIKREITEIRNGSGKSVYWLKAYPVDTDNDGNPVIAIYMRDYHTDVWEEIESDDYVVDTETGRVEFIESMPAAGPQRVKFVYTAGRGEQTRDEITNELTAVDIDAEWQSMALQAVYYLHQRDLASFSRVQEGVFVAAETLPRLVVQFLKQHRRVLA